jgi:N-acetylglutamate synthase-like GNAT family acetyltransferase
VLKKTSDTETPQGKLICQVHCWPSKLSCAAWPLLTETAGVTVSIRRATEKDVPEVSALLQAAFVEYRPLYTPGGYAATTVSAEEIARRIREEGPTWVAAKDGMVVGTVSAVFKEGDLYVRSMAVAPGARGEKIGSRLMEQVEEFALGSGCTRQFLSTTPFLDRAIALYKQCGFDIVEGAEHELHGTALLLMEKVLR